MALVVFLRGVNVGGHKTFQPSVLARDMAEYDVVNIGAAGTFVVRKPISQTKLRAELFRRLPFEPKIMICSGSDLMRLAAGDPFASQHSGPDIVRFLSVLAKPPGILCGIPLSLPAGDDWLVKIIAVRGRFALGLYRRSMRTIGFLGQVEKRLGVPATTRNWNTINAVVKILKGAHVK
jgi:uncharacterized protein (DUF1697 family)